MLPLQGHHGGLHDRFEMMDWFKGKQDRPAGAIAIARQRVPDLLPAAQLRFPAYVRSTDPLSLEFFLRMLFLALVDADFLDTERHFSPEAATLPAAAVPDLHLSTAPAATPDLCRLHRGCSSAAGFLSADCAYRGGKTRSGMAFALRRALAHGMQRVVVAVPYLTITQQTTGVYRQIFERDGDAGIARAGASQCGGRGALGRPRRTRRRRCRRTCSDPILDALQELCTNYGASVVLSTATQPAYKAVAIFARVQAREIVPKPQRFPLEEFILFDLNPERLLAVLRRGSGRRS